MMLSSWRPCGGGAWAPGDVVWNAFIEAESTADGDGGRDGGLCGRIEGMRRSPRRWPQSRSLVEHGLEIVGRLLPAVSLRGGEGTIFGIVIGSAIMRVIDNGINMFQLPYLDKDGINRIWRLNPNWTFVIIGTVILVAVVLDQIVHIVQTRQRIRGAGKAAQPG